MSDKEMVKMADRFDELFLPTTKEDLFKLSEMYSKSNLVPACYRGKQADIVIAWSLGMPLGLNMMQCLLGIAVINGRPSLWGDVLNGLVQCQPDLEKFDEVFDEAEFKWTCTIKRKGRDKVSRTFSKTEAVEAGLLPGKDGSAWKKYPKRMVQMRARGFCVRDSYSDKLCGLGIEPGELIDITDSAVVIDKPNVHIAEKIAAKAENVTEAPPTIETAPQTVPPINQEEQGVTPKNEGNASPPTEEPQTGKFKDIQEVVGNFRAAADIASLESMKSLVDEVDPAFKGEATTCFYRALQELNQENKGSEKPEMSENELVKKLSVISVGINADDKAVIAGELFNDGRRKNFRVRELDGNDLVKLKGILEKRGLFKEEE